MRRCCSRPAAIATPPPGRCCATAGLACWAVLLVVLLDGRRRPAGPRSSPGRRSGSGALLVLVAVALGRGWRSAWWSRRAEVAESLTGALAIGAVVVAAGLFRLLWELTG